MEFVLWFFAAYGLISLVWHLWHDLKKKREWTVVAFVSDPNTAEGELRSFLADLPSYKSVPKKLLLIWEDQNYDLARTINQEFPQLEIEELVGNKPIEEMIGEVNSGKIIVLKT